MTKSYPSRTRRNTTIAEALEITFLPEEQKSRASNQINSITINPSPEEIWIAGRIVGILDDGFVLQDESGRIDLFFEKPVNVGDIIEAKININRKTEEYFILAPCIDDFFIRREDPNFVKMIIDQHLKAKIDQSSQILQMIRNFFLEKDFLEMDTPLLVNFPGMEPYLDVFKTSFFENPKKPELSHDMYLITSPEYAMKKLLTAGYEKIFQLNKSFRNKETSSTLHNPEFTMLEWYRAYANYENIMKDTEELINHLAIQIQGNSSIKFQGKTIDTTLPWPRMKVKEAFKQFTNIDEEQFENPEKFREVAKQKGYPIDEKSSHDDIFFYIFMNEIEPKLGFEKPVILYDYPLSMAALSKACVDNPKYAERFEVYIAGIELCNAFTELNDPIEQENRLQQERIERQKMEKDDYPVDPNFIRALKLGMPPSSGNALGIDRLIMLLTDTPDIRDILPFPLRDL